MQAAGFCALFTGIESPDEETLAHMQKKQNTRRSLAASIRKIYSYGMYVNTGYILGFDTERPGAAQGMLDLIEESATAVSMVGMLFALPGTQLSRRLAREGRLGGEFRLRRFERHRRPHALGTQFRDRSTARTDHARLSPRHRRRSSSPRPTLAACCGCRWTLQLRGKKLGLPWRRRAKDLAGAARLIWRQGILAPHRVQFWRVYATLLRKNPAALRYAAVLIAQYDHFGPFHKTLLGQPGPRDHGCRIAARERAAGRTAGAGCGVNS